VIADVDGDWSIRVALSICSNEKAPNAAPKETLGWNCGTSPKTSALAIADA